MFFRRHWFLLGLAIACVFGYLAPEFGRSFHPYLSWIVAAIMFLVGLGETAASLFESARNLRAVSFALANNYLFAPLLGFLMASLMFSDVPALFAGVLVMSSVPTTVASSVVWSRISGGNVSLSLILTVTSTAAGTVLTPLVLDLSLRKAVDVPALQMIWKLVLVAVGPVIVAQLARQVVPALSRLARSSPELGQGLILLLVLAAVSQSAGLLSLNTISQVLLAVVTVNLAISLFSYAGAGWLGLERPERISVLFASSQKTITLGLLVGLTYFAGEAGIPVLLYHVFQQFTGFVKSRLLRSF